MAATDVTPEEIRTLLKEMLVDEFDIEPELITDDATLEKLDLDSLDLVEIGQVIEQRYGVRIKASDAEGVEDLGGVIAMIHQTILAGPDADGSGEGDADAKQEMKGAA